MTDVIAVITIVIFFSILTFIVGVLTTVNWFSKEEAKQEERKKKAKEANKLIELESRIVGIEVTLERKNS
jgi:flagellar basal body-associated protein FliL